MTRFFRDPGPEAWERFLVGWHGPGAAGTPEPAHPEGMPDPLRHFHGLIAKWPDAVVQNHLVTRIDGEKLIFYVENQGVCEWATSPEDGDPQSGSADSLGDERDEWQLEDPPLSAFLLQLLAFEAAIGAEHGASVAWLDRPTLARVIEPLERLPFGAWRWPAYPTDFYANDDVVAIVAPNPGPVETAASAEYVSLTLGALNAEALAYLDEVASPSWEWLSRRER